MYPYYIENDSRDVEAASKALVSAAQTEWRRQFTKGYGSIDDTTCVIVFLKADSEGSEQLVKPANSHTENFIIAVGGN